MYHLRSSVILFLMICVNIVAQNTKNISAAEQNYTYKNKYIMISITSPIEVRKNGLLNFKVVLTNNSNKNIYVMNNCSPAFIKDNSTIVIKCGGSFVSDYDKPLKFKIIKPKSKIIINVKEFIETIVGDNNVKHLNIAFSFGYIQNIQDAEKYKTLTKIKTVIKDDELQLSSDLYQAIMSEINLKIFGVNIIN